MGGLRPVSSTHVRPPAGAGINMGHPSRRQGLQVAGEVCAGTRVFKSQLCELAQVLLQTRPPWNGVPPCSRLSRTWVEKTGEAPSDVF